MVLTGSLSPGFTYLLARVNPYGVRQSCRSRCGACGDVYSCGEVAVCNYFVLALTDSTDQTFFLHSSSSAQATLPMSCLKANRMLTSETHYQISWSALKDQLRKLLDNGLELYRTWIALEHISFQIEKKIEALRNWAHDDAISLSDPRWCNAILIIEYDVVIVIAATVIARITWRWGKGMSSHRTKLRVDSQRAGRMMSICQAQVHWQKRSSCKVTDNKLLESALDIEQEIRHMTLNFSSNPERWRAVAWYAADACAIDTTRHQWHRGTAFGTKLQTQWCLAAHNVHERRNHEDQIGKDILGLIQVEWHLATVEWHGSWSWCHVQARWRRHVQQVGNQTSPSCLVPIKMLAV